MTIFSPRPPLLSSPLLIRRRDALARSEEGERRGATDSSEWWNPFLPTKLETIGKRLRDARRQRGESERANGQEKSSSSRASERTTDADGRTERSERGKTKIDAFKVFPYPPLSGGGIGGEEGGRRGKPSLRSHSPPLLFYPPEKPTDQWRFKKIF